MPASRPRVQSLDGLRGLAALIVLVHHSLLVVPALAAPYYGGRAEPGATWLLVHTPLHLLWGGTEAVYLFFILSGLVLSLAARSRSFTWRSYYPSRIVRLYVPVIGAVVLAGIVIALVPRDGATESVWLSRRSDDYPISSMLEDATLLGGPSGVVSPLWSLYWEVLFSLLLPVYLYAARRMPAWLQAVIAVALSTIGTLEGVTALKYLPMFGLGVALAAGWERLGETVGRMPRAVAIPAWTVAVAGALVLTSSYWLVLPYTDRVTARAATMPLTLVGVAILIVAAVHAGLLARILSSRPFLFLGTISFSLYLVHEPIVIAIGHLVPRPFMTVLIALPVALLVAVVFYHVVERPAHLLAKRVRDHAANEVVPAPARGGDRPSAPVDADAVPDGVRTTAVVGQN
ncbi:acyltransferase family protein [Agromyces sp. Marseille-Q5079]|uniref:acyltransferase family protein n=1 Tax=Agromyces sp. Marseille-Q5079 TaxID=3439059 RepID=UPI003D9C9CEA